MDDKEKMTETQFKIKVLRYLKDNLDDAFMYKASDKFTSGIPDILLLYRGVFAAIELKVQKNKASKIQEVVIARIQKAGGMAWVVTDNNISNGMEQIRIIVELIKSRAEGR